MRKEFHWIIPGIIWSAASAVAAVYMLRQGADPAWGILLLAGIAFLVVYVYALLVGAKGEDTK